MTFKKTVGTILKIALTLVVVYFVYHQVNSNWTDIKEYQWQIDYWTLLLSVLVGLGTFVIMSSNWQRLILGFGHKVSLTKSFRIFYLSDMGRYIPGKIWPLLGILYLTKKEGIPPEQATASFVLVQMFAIPASLLVFVVALQLEPGLLVDQVAVLGATSTYLLTAVWIALSALLVLWPQRLLRMGNAVLRRLSRPQVHFALDKKVALRLFVGYAVGWFCYGIAFYLFVMSVIPQADLSLIAAAGIFNAAYQIGYLTLFAPGGLGPREMVMGFMLAPFLGPIAPLVPVLARLWAILIEVTAALIALCIRK
ncbi:MAG: flippase-like domain-containing protein [candidate division Zixibacteria bacterium]|nr:flippase-like domain-containing protein [candidate division Zixibacteria bacterium]MDH3936815.1 flippase-like domain-containing protein [candidate division Zixibacteria bacterium]MDH4033892.1 flippase-like domain-containing protein [candidate division Zixibacteria bacterium]